MANPQSSKFDGENSKDNYYRNKCKTLKQIIKDNIFENAAICDEIGHTQEKVIVVREECKFLSKKLKVFEAQAGTTTLANVETNSTKKNTSRKKANGVSKPKRPAPKRKKNAGENIQEPFTSGNVTIFNFGQIVYDTPFYYSDSAIYPAGYYATRTYAHFRNLFSKCTYHCKVIKAGSSPRFEIMDHDKHFKVTGLSTDECHSHLVSLINKMLGAEDLIPANGNGDRFFGLTLPQVRFKLQASPESKYCTGYIPLKSQCALCELNVSPQKLINCSICDVKFPITIEPQLFEPPLYEISIIQTVIRTLKCIVIQPQILKNTPLFVHCALMINPINGVELIHKFENYEAEMKAENDPSVSFEGLHACLNKFRSRH